MQGSPRARANLCRPSDTPTPLSLDFPICEIGRKSPPLHVCPEGAGQSQGRVAMAEGYVPLSRRALIGAREASGSQLGSGAAQELPLPTTTMSSLPKSREMACGMVRT